MENVKDEIRVCFMGRSSIKLGKSNLVFPYLKLKLLFFILLERRTITRDALCRLLWEDTGETARQNLRNALSRLRHMLPVGLLNIDRRRVSVTLEWPIVSDLEWINAEVLDLNTVSELLAPFLEDIETSDPCFSWVYERRRHYRQKLQLCLSHKWACAEEGDKIRWQRYIDFMKNEERKELGEDQAIASPKIENAVVQQSSFPDGLTTKELELLECIAVFKTEASFEDLKLLSGFEDMDLIRVYEGLLRKKILKSRGLGSKSYAILFVNSLHKEYIHSRISDIKRWKMNQMLASILRPRLLDLPNPRGFALLADYARESGNTLVALEAEVHGLCFHFQLAHELFPIFSDAELTKATLPANDFCFTGDFLNRVKSMLDQLMRQMGRTDCLIEFERIILTLQGAFFRWTGSYADALNCLEEAMKLAYTSERRVESMLDVLEQFCYLGIQKDDASLLRRYAFHFYRQALGEHMHPNLGMALRFLAVLNIMEKHYEAAEKLLDMSIRVFEKLETRGNAYTLSLIAAVQYKGDIALHQRNHEAAFNLYLRCVRLCDDKGFYRVQGLHFGKLAWCAIRLGRLKETRKYLDSASQLVNMATNSLGSSLYGGELIYALSAFLNIWEGRTTEAALDLRKAVVMSTVIQKPFWNALFFCLLALLKKYATPEVSECLKESSEFYLNESKQLFDLLCLEHEIEAYEQLEKLLKLDVSCRAYKTEPTG